MNTTPEKLCNALCPASRTLVYWGAPIKAARSSNGTRYSDLTTAFDYRKQIVPNCTCNGNDIFGTAAISIHEDISLRPGDVVVTKHGTQVFIGPAGEKHKPSAFVSLRNYSGLPESQRRKLSEIEVTRRAPLEPEPLDINSRIVFGPRPLPSSLMPTAQITRD